MSRFFSALWRAITLLRLGLTNILFLASLVILWIVLRGGAPTPLPDRAALLLDLQGRVVDQPQPVQPLAALGGGGATREMRIGDLIDAVDYARKDERITSLVMDVDGLVYIGQSKAIELAAALARFRETGKPVIAVGDYYTQDQYRIAVEADEILMHPMGAVALEGYAVYINYFAEALEKLSVTMHVFKAGEHKSIAEPLLRSDMSDGEREITSRWLEQLWATYTRDIETRRELEAGSLGLLIDEYPQRLATHDGDPAALALDVGLVDQLMSRPERERYLAERVGATDDDGRFEGIAVRDYLRRMRPGALEEGSKHIAIVTAQGNMLPGEQPAGRIGGDSLSALLRQAAKQDGVAAIVLRVNTGGGSAFAGQVIREEISRIRAGGIPVVISMGSVAASGGYYIAANADRIYATEATITGSIGVFGAFPTVDRLLARGGVYTDGVGTTAVAGGLRPDRPLNPLLEGTIQQGIDKLHRDFITLVAEGRGLDESVVAPIADGRVLAAREAMSLGLVDEIGGLEDAVEGAAEIAGLDDYQLIEVLKPLSPQQLLMQRLSNLVQTHDLQGTAGTRYTGLTGPARYWLAPVAETAELLSSFADPHHLYMRCLQCGGG